MKIRQFVQIILLLAITLLLCGLIASFMKYRIWDINNFGFQFLFFVLLGCCIYISLQYLRLFETFFVSIFLALIFAFIMRRTSLIYQFQSFFNLVLYAVALFAVYTIIFRFFWFNNTGYLRNITFSLVSAFGYTIVHLLTHLLLAIPIKSNVLLNYFMNGLVIMITLSFSFSLTDLIFARIDPIFFQQPGSNDSDSEEDDSTDADFDVEDEEEL